MKQIKARYKINGNVRIPKGYKRLLCSMRSQKGDYYLENKYKFIPRFKYNEEYEMPTVETDVEFMQLLYANCLLINEAEIKNKYNGPYTYFLEQLKAQKDYLASSTPIAGVDIPGISRQELYDMFIQEAKVQNSKVDLDEEQKQIFWKPSLGRGGAGYKITSFGIYIRKKNKFPIKVENHGVNPNESIFFDKPGLSDIPKSDISPLILPDNLTPNLL